MIGQRVFQNHNQNPNNSLRRDGELRTPYYVIRKKNSDLFILKQNVLNVMAECRGE